MKVRIGIHPSPRYGAALRDIGASAMLSANALWKNSRFRRLKADAFGGHPDVALDSAGFVAMAVYRHYRWTVDDYVQLADSWPWAWWAAMDFCCEPEVAKDRAEVLDRVCRTVHKLADCRTLACARGVKEPMPVLQGWLPDDYERCADMMGELPKLVGLGSVCRRRLLGTDGVFKILGRLDRALPRHVRLHLFGVKGAAIHALVGHPRIESIDSMAWDYACRRETEMPRTVEKRVDAMQQWWFRQTSARSLFGAAQ
jgi:hypothetical protein